MPGRGHLCHRPLPICAIGHNQTQHSAMHATLDGTCCDRHVQHADAPEERSPPGPGVPRAQRDGQLQERAHVPHYAVDRSARSDVTCFGFFGLKHLIRFIRDV